MNYIIDLIKGMIIGIANIIPGVSGGTMMVSMNLYDKLIHSITHLFSQPKKSLLFLAPILIGAALAIVLLSGLFSWLLTNWSLPTNFLFCGLILGALPMLAGKVARKKITPVCLICFAVFFLIVTVPSLFQFGTEGEETFLTLSFFEAIKLFVIGIIAAATMVIPGVSGSMILMVLGYYHPILATITQSLKVLMVFDLGSFFSYFLSLAFFGLGVIVGIFLIAKLVEYLLSHFRKESYWAILGLVTASPIAVLMHADWSQFSLWILLLSLVCLVLGFAASILLERLGPKPKKKRPASRNAS